MKLGGRIPALRAQFAQGPPAAIVNATAFSAIGDDGTTPFDAMACPVFQIALSTARREDWAESLRGLSPDSVGSPGDLIALGEAREPGLIKPVVGFRG